MYKRVIALSSLVVVVLLLLAFHTYSINRAYFCGAVDTYIQAQQIPENKIIRKERPAFIWGNPGTWEESIYVKSHGEKYKYIYDMDGRTKAITLTIYPDRDGVLYIDKLDYPPLRHLKY